MSEFIGNYVAGDGVRNRHSFSFLYCGISILLSLLLAFPFAKATESLVLKIREYYIYYKGENVLMNKKIVVGLFVCVWGILYLAFYPGIFGGDIASRWNQYINRDYST